MELRTRHLPTRRSTVTVAFAALALGACMPMITRPPGPSTPPTAPVQVGPGRYVPSRDAASVPELRAAPPPAHAEIVDSQSPAGDDKVLGAKGFVRIGDGYYRGEAERARGWFADRAHDVGADRVQLYAGDAAPELHGAFYVHFKLPFGATFRDLSADERQAAGSGGVRLLEVIGHSPASEANLLPGDVVVALGDAPVRDHKQFQELLRQHMGKRVTLTLQRNGGTLTRPVRLGVLPGGSDK